MKRYARLLGGGVLALGAVSQVAGASAPKEII